MAVLAATALADIRIELREPTAAFWTDAEIMKYLDEGMRKQHEIVIRHAKMSGRLRDHAHPYLAAYIDYASGSLVDGTTDYSLPAAYFEAVSFSTGLSSSTLSEARRIGPEDEWLARQFPQQYGPTAGQALWLIAPTAAAVRKLRVFAAGDGIVPKNTDAYELTFIRDITQTEGSTSGSLDISSPYDEGPREWAVGRAFEKQGQDAAPWFQKFKDAAERIIPAPPQPSQAAA